MWAPALRWHNGRFHVLFSANDTHTTHLFTAEDARGPWRHHIVQGFYHDPSLLFDDGRVFSIVESKYDEEGHVTRADHFGLDGSSQGYQTYEYDEAGQQTVMYDYDAEGILRTELRYTYDADRCTGYTSHDGNGTLIGRSEYLYDEQGQIVGDIMYGPDGEVLWEQTSEH